MPTKYREYHTFYSGTNKIGMTYIFFGPYRMSPWWLLPKFTVEFHFPFLILQNFISYYQTCDFTCKDMKTLFLIICGVT